MILLGVSGAVFSRSMVLGAAPLVGNDFATTARQDRTVFGAASGAVASRSVSNTIIAIGLTRDAVARAPGKLAGLP